MKAFENKNPAPPENPGFRFYLGLAFFMISFMMLPIGLVLKGFVASHSWKGFIIGIFWLSAPLMKIFGIAVLGKPSYLWIKYKLHLYRKVAIPHHVSQARYNLGLFLFVFPFIPNYILSYAPNLFPDAYLIRTAIHLFFDLVFFSSLFVLGGNFWDKLRALFVYSANAEFNKESEVI